MSRARFIGEGLFLTKPVPPLHVGVIKSPLFSILYGVPNSAFFPYAPRMDLTPTALSPAGNSPSSFPHGPLSTSHQLPITSHRIRNSFKLHSYVTLRGVGGYPRGYGTGASLAIQTRRMPDNMSLSSPPRPATRLVLAIRRLPALSPLLTPPATDLHRQLKSFHSPSRTDHSPLATRHRSEKYRLGISHRTVSIVLVCLED